MANNVRHRSFVLKSDHHSGILSLGVSTTIIQLYIQCDKPEIL